MRGLVGGQPRDRGRGTTRHWARGRTGPLCSVAGAILLLALNLWPRLAAIPAQAADASANASSTASLSDAYASGEAMPHSLGQPTSWAWKGAMPGVRSVVYYGIDGAPDGGVVGWYNVNGDQLDRCMINQLYAQAQQYGPVLEKPSHPGPPCSMASQELPPWNGVPADPSHPVMMGLDVVNPTVQPANGDGTCTNDCVSRLSPDRLQHFVNLTRDNHMYLWFDMTLGRSPVQKELAEIWPYLQLPWVQVALDPEWDFVYGGSCGSGLPNFDTGRMRASEINYVIDQLSALVQARHLPPKILILHEFAPEVNPANKSNCADSSKSVAIPAEGWDHIQLKPGVQIVVNADGFGGPDAKGYIYNLFDSVQHIQYGGFKLFYAVNSLHDAPLMTPYQVIGMNPSPLLIMFA